MIIILLIAAVITAACQLLRIYILSRKNTDRPQKGHLFRINETFNRGMAFGIFKTGIVPLSITSGILLAGILGMSIYLAKNKMLNFLSILGTGLLLGGGISNFIERVKYGRVFDYINFYKSKIKRFRKYIFNLADFSIFLGVIFLIISLFKKSR